MVMVPPSAPNGSGSSNDQLLKLPPIRSFEPTVPSSMDLSSTPPCRYPNNSPGGSSSNAIAPDDKASSTSDKQQVDATTSGLSRPQLPLSLSAPSLPNSHASTPPSPPPPAPVSNLPSHHTPYESAPAPVRANRSNDSSQSPAYAPYALPRAPGMLPWQVSSSTSLDPSTVYALERIHSASLALHDHVGELLRSQSVASRQDEMHSFLPFVSEINHEVRGLMSTLDNRAGREAFDIAPYYPWLPGSNATQYWSQNIRDERGSKRMRCEDDKDGHVRRRSLGQHTKSEQRLVSRSDLRPSNSTDDLIYAARPGTDHHGFSSSSNPNTRSDASSYASAFGTASSTPSKGSLGHDTSVSVQQAYVPKYRKRSRAPAPGVCHSCGNGDTPEWRRGPDGARTLCNACGLHFAKLVRKRTLEYANSAPGIPIPPVTIAELRQSTNVNLNSPGVIQADDERARIASNQSSSATSLTHGRFPPRSRSESVSSAVATPSSTVSQQHVYPDPAVSGSKTQESLSSKGGEESSTDVVSSVKTGTPM